MEDYKKEQIIQLFNQNFKSLTTKYNAPSETGFGERVNGSGQNEYVNLNASGSSSLEPFSGMMNFTHFHNNHPKQNSNGDEYDGAVKIQSPGDIFNLIKKCQPSNSNPKEAYCIMLSDEGIFALTIIDPIPQSFLQSPEWTIFKNDFKKEAQKITGNLNSNPTERKDKLQKMLLGLLKKAGLENKIGLFEANIENDIVEINISWTRKTLAPNSTPNNIQINEEPCN